MTNKEKITSFAKNGYDDKPERKAFRKMIYRDESFKNWIKDYFQLNMEEGPFRIIEDPLGEYQVDLGMIGLIHHIHISISPLIQSTMMLLLPLEK